MFSIKINLSVVFSTRNARNIHRFSTVDRENSFQRIDHRRILKIEECKIDARVMVKMLLLVATGVSLLGASRVDAADAVLLRLFLTNGTAVVSYGEYARVGDRVVFSMPMGSGDAPVLHLVNMPSRVVDWSKTTRYADSARADRYAATRGESDYAVLTASVAQTLNGIATAPNESQRLALALQARRELDQWPGQHYGYRATDVRQILGILDEVITELRAAAGETRFDLNLVAVAEPASLMTLLPPPSTQESIAQAMAVAKFVDVAADRVSLLTVIVGALDRNTSTLPPEWAKRERREAVNAIAVEARVDRAYGNLTRRAVRAASSAAARADVGAVEGLLDAVARRDEQLGGWRPDEVNALLAAIQERLDAARRLRLARDRWIMRQDAFVAYRQSIKSAIEEFARSRPRLESIRRLAGPETSVLVTLGTRLETTARRLGRIQPPDEFKAAHALLVSASKLATNAVDIRREAVRSGSLASAWDASAAAAGAMMLVSRARSDMDTLFKFPQLR